MLNIYFLVVFWYWVLGKLSKKVKINEEVSIHERVCLNDLDYNIHMNNATYANKFEYGRQMIMIRTGIWDAVKEVKGVVYAYSVTIRYRRELKPFQKFDVVSKIVGWDDRNMFIEQRIVVGGFVHAVATSKMVMAKGTFTAVLEALGHKDPSPPLPKDILSWTEYDNLSSQKLRAEANAGQSPIPEKKTN